MRVVRAEEGNFIRLWRQGEDEVTRVEFDLTPYISEFGEGTPQLVVKRPGDSQGYVAPITRDGNTAVWVVGPEWLVAEGQGQCQLSWFVKGGGKAKSDTYKTHVQESIDDSQEPVPEAQEGYLAQMQSIGTMVVETADCVQNMAEDVATQVTVAQEGANVATAKANEATEVLKKLETLASDGYVRFETGTYVGSGACGSWANANTLKFKFKPQLVIVKRRLNALPSTNTGTTEHMMVALYGERCVTTGRYYGEIGYHYLVTMAWDNQQVSWYGSSVDRQLNRADSTYQYIAFG